MKRIFLFALACTLSVVSCEKYDDAPIKDALASLENRITALEKLGGEVAVLKQIVEGKAMIVSCVEDEGKYTITLSDGKVLDVSKVIVGTPVVTLLQINGKFYWAYYIDGQIEPLTIGGKKVEVASSAVPQIRTNDEGFLEVSVDEGKTWTPTEAKLESGLFSAVEKQDDCVILTLADGVTQYAVPLLAESEVEFVALTGKQFFAYGQSQTVNVQMVGIEGYTITEKPEGWKATLSEGQLKITAPAEGAGDTSGYIKMLGVGEKPKIAQVYVTIGTAPCKISIDDSWQVNIKPVSKSCFYGAVLLEEFSAREIVAELSGVLPMQSRRPFTASEITVPLENLVGEIVAGQTYVVWALPTDGGTCVETDVIYQAVTSVGVTSEVTNVTFENAALTVRVKGTDTYYLVPMAETMTLDNVIADLNGPYAGTYDRYKHMSTYRGTLAELVDMPLAGSEYSFLVLPVKFGKPLKADAQTFSVKLNSYTSGSSVAVTLSKGQVEYKSFVSSVTASGAHKILIAAISASEYAEKGYAIDNTLLDYMKTLTPRVYSESFDFEAKNLESGTKYWVVAVAVDRDGSLGQISRLEVSTKAVEYSNVVLTLGSLVATMNTAEIPVSASSDVDSYRYLLMSSNSGGYWYTTYIEDDSAAYNALIYGTTDFVDVKASEFDGKVRFEDLEFGANYVFRIIGYDKDGKITNMGKLDFAPTVGAVIASSKQQWVDFKPEVTTSITGTSLEVSVTFPLGCDEFVMTKVSSEEYDAYMPSAARLRTDYVVGHSSVLTFTKDLKNYTPDWYISSDKPYLLISWKMDGVWYEPLVYDTATGQTLN